MYMRCFTDGFFLENTFLRSLPPPSFPIQVCKKEQVYSFVFYGWDRFFFYITLLNNKNKRNIFFEEFELSVLI